jgi:hypothetical protein
MAKALRVLVWRVDVLELDMEATADLEEVVGVMVVTMHREILDLKPQHLTVVCTVLLERCITIIMASSVVVEVEP